MVVGGCRWLLVVVGGCWWWLVVVVGGCWWLLMNVDGCRRMLMAVDRCRWLLTDIDALWMGSKLPALQVFFNSSKTEHVITFRQLLLIY